MTKTDPDSTAPRPRQIIFLPSPSNSPASPKRKREDDSSTKWTPEDAKILKKLKDEGLSYRQMCESHFPQVTPNALAKAYNRWEGTLDPLTVDEVAALRRAIEEKKKVFWNEVGSALGKSGSACQKAAKENSIIVFA